MHNFPSLKFKKPFRSTNTALRRRQDEPEETMSNYPTADDYVLARNIAARSRLNLQHFLFSKSFGYILHPDIPRRENLKVADVATGSAIWMLDVMSDLPSSTSFHGFDIDLSQAPPKEWLPPNITLSKFDLNQPVPTEFQNTFDIINIRLLALVIKGNDPTEILKTAQQMLKPGGWLQWTEPSILKAYTDMPTASLNFSGSAMKTLYEKMIPNDPRFRPTWPLQLSEFFEAVGFENVQQDTKQPKDFLPWLAFINDNGMLVYQELIGRMPPGANRTEFEHLYNKAAKEAWSGTAVNAVRVNVIGQKPMTGTGLAVKK